MARTRSKHRGATRASALPGVAMAAMIVAAGTGAATGSGGAADRASATTIVVAQADSAIVAATPGLGSIGADDPVVPDLLEDPALDKAPLPDIVENPPSAGDAVDSVGGALDSVGDAADSVVDTVDSVADAVAPPDRITPPALPPAPGIEVPPDNLTPPGVTAPSENITSPGEMAPIFAQRPGPDPGLRPGPPEPGLAESGMAAGPGAMGATGGGEAADGGRAAGGRGDRDSFPEVSESIWRSIKLAPGGVVVALLTLIALSVAGVTALVVRYRRLRGKAGVTPPA